jgi:hypothetical protein
MREIHASTKPSLLSSHRRGSPQSGPLLVVPFAAEPRLLSPLSIINYQLPISSHFKERGALAPQQSYIYHNYMGMQV